MKSGVAALVDAVAEHVARPHDCRGVQVVLTAGDPLDLDAHLGPLDAELARWPFATSGFLTERTLDATINWKAALEAFAENYHFASVHGGSIIGQNTVPNTAGYDAYGVHHRLAFPSPWISPRPRSARSARRS